MLLFCSFIAVCILSNIYNASLSHSAVELELLASELQTTTATPQPPPIEELKFGGLSGTNVDLSDNNRTASRLKLVCTD